MHSPSFYSHGQKALDSQKGSIEANRVQIVGEFNAILVLIFRFPQIINPSQQI